MVEFEPKKSAFHIKANFSDLCIGNPEVQAQACGADGNGGVIYASWLGDGKRRRNERIGVSRRFQIVDEICLKVAADFQDGLCSRQLKKSVVLGVKRHVIEASGCDGVLRKLPVTGRGFANMRGGGADARRFRGLNGAILPREGAVEGVGCGLSWCYLCFRAFKPIDFRLHLGHLRLHLLDKFS